MAKSSKSKTPHPSAAGKSKRESQPSKGEGKKAKVVVEKKTKEKAPKAAAKEKKPEVEVKKAEPEDGEREFGAEQSKTLKPERYFEAVGRRKTAIARVRLYTKPGDFTVNDKLYSIYFPAPDLQRIAEDSLQKMKLFGRFKVSIKASGGGLHSQAEAVRHGLARCLVKFNPDFRKRLKRAGFIKRDPRMKERKKFGLKKARKAPQWAKR